VQEEKDGGAGRITHECLIQYDGLIGVVPMQNYGKIMIYSIEILTFYKKYCGV